MGMVSSQSEVASDTQAGVLAIPFRGRNEQQTFGIGIDLPTDCLSDPRVRTGCTDKVQLVGDIHELAASDLRMAQAAPLDAVSWRDAAQTAALVAFFLVRILARSLKGAA